MHFKRPRPNTEVQQGNKDMPLIYQLFEIENGHVIFSFQNGITVLLKPLSIGAEVRICTPTLDITHRFTSKFKTDFIYSPENLLNLFNFIVKLPNVYTINEIPDSCFDFEKSRKDT